MTRGDQILLEQTVRGDHLSRGTINFVTGVMLRPRLFSHLLYSFLLAPLQTQEMSKADSYPILNFQTHSLN